MNKKVSNIFSMEKVFNECVNRDITLTRRQFTHFLIQAFRYALDREETGASQDMAEDIETYWNYIMPEFQEQIKRDVKNAIDMRQLKERDTIKAWEVVLGL